MRPAGCNPPTPLVGVIWLWDRYRFPSPPSPGTPIFAENGRFPLVVRSFPFVSVRRPLVVRWSRVGSYQPTSASSSTSPSSDFRRKWSVSVGFRWSSVGRPLVVRWSRVRLYQPTSGPCGGSETLTRSVDRDFGAPWELLASLFAALLVLVIFQVVFSSSSSSSRSILSSQDDPPTLKQIDFS